MPAFLSLSQWRTYFRVSSRVSSRTSLLHKAPYVAALYLSTLLVGCTNEQDEAAPRPDINTFNIVFAPLADNVNLTGIYSYDPNSQQSALRASHKAGEQFSVELDTDRDKPGYEYLAYVGEDDLDAAREAVYLFNYDKDSGGRIRKLFRVPQKICSIGARARNDESVIDERDRRRSVLAHKSSIVIKVAKASNPNCATEDTLNYELSFDFSQASVRDQTKLRQESYYIRETLVNYRGSDDDERGKVYYLADNQAGTALLIDEDNTLVWSAPLPDNAQRFFALQADNDNVIMQAGSRLFVKALYDLVAASEPSPNNPYDTVAERAFGPIFYQLQNADEQNPAILYPDAQGRIFQDGQQLVVHNNQQFTEVTELDAAVVDAQVIVLGGDDIAMVMRYSDRAEFAHAKYSGGQWLLSSEATNGQAAKAMNIAMHDAALILNIRGLGRLDDSLEALYTESLDREPKRFQNAVILPRTQHELRLESPQLYLLSSEQINANKQLINPRLYAFDSTRLDGRKLKQSVAESQQGRTDVDELYTQFGQITATLDDYQTPIRFNNIQSAFVRYTASGIATPQWLWFNPENPQ